MLRLYEYLLLETSRRYYKYLYKEIEPVIGMYLLFTRISKIKKN